MTGQSPVEPRRRLHPLTPLLRGAKFVALAIAGISWQGYANLGPQRWIMAVAAVVVVALLGSVVSWFVTGYHVVGRELRIYEGLLSRRTRVIPLERLQAVELVHPLIARPFGLAELRLEVVGGEKTEAPLAYLPVADAVALREQLLSLARFRERTEPPAAAVPDAAAAAAEPGVAEPTERPVHAVPDGDLMLSQLMRLHWLALPLGIAGPIIFFAYEGEVSFIAVASTITAVIGAIQAPLRALLADWRFTITSTPDGLRLRRGLLETRSQTVPPGRIQAVRVEWPLLWRPFGWVRARMEIAGIAGTGEGAGPHGATLLPVANVPTAEYVLGEALPGFRLTSVAVRPVPRRVAWIAPLRHFVLGCQVGDAGFVTRDGLLTRQLTIVAYGRIQSARIRQGPLQRLLRVANVYVDAAGLVAVAPHRDVAEARALAAELAERSRQARHRTSSKSNGLPDQAG